MLSDFKIARTTRRCASLGRPLKPGEWYWSVLAAHDEDLIRSDISAEAWVGPPEGALGHWKNQMPKSDRRRLILAPDSVLCDLFVQLSSESRKEFVCYLLALLLLRRRLARAIGQSKAEPGLMHLEMIRDGKEIQIHEVDISPALARQLQAELTELLYCEAE